MPHWDAMVQMRATTVKYFSSQLLRAKRAIGATMFCILAVALTLICPNAFALNPDWQIYQYGHRAWKIDDGFIGSVVYALAQDKDGYLWIGADKGVFRFDGIRITQWNPPDGSRLPSGILSLLADRDGSLWIGTIDGLVHWDHGCLTRYKENQAAFVFSLSQDQDGAVWFNPVQLRAGSDDVLWTSGFI
jgi:Two component regulator propeller